MKRTPLYCLGLAAALLGCSSVSSTPTLCELAKNRSAYADQTVTVEGTLLVSRHGTNIEDESCDNGVSVNWRDDSPGLREITNIIEGEVVERNSMRVRMTGQMKLVESSGLVKGPVWQLQVTNGQLLR
jgi:hypothetical protein